MVVKLGGAQREACVGSPGGQVRVGRGEGRLELVGVGGIGRLMMWVDGWGRKNLVWVRSWVVGVGTNPHSHLVNYRTSLGVREAVAGL